MTENKNKNNNYIYKIVLILLLIIAMVIVWILLGEFNYSKLNWMVPHNGPEYGVVLNDNNMPEFDKYGKVYDFIINSNNVITTWQPYIICLSILVAAILFNLILIPFKKMSIMFCPYVIAVWTASFSLIVTGLLPYNTNWTIIVRIIIVLFSFPIAFLLSNLICKQLLLRFGDSYEYASNLIRKQKESSDYIQTLKAKSPKTKKQKEAEDQTTIIIDEQ